MTSLIPSTPQTDPIVYPTGDGQPVAETYDHLYALLITLEVLRQYLSGQQATVLANQFLSLDSGPRSAIQISIVRADGGAGVLVI